MGLIKCMWPDEDEEAHVYTDAVGPTSSGRLQAWRDLLIQQ